MLTRRDVLKGTVIGAAAVVALPVTAAPVPNLTPVVTLERLAAESKFASVELSLPIDVCTTEFRFTLNGKPYTEFMIKEIYAPGDDTGWAVIYTPIRDDMVHRTRVVYGNWGLHRIGCDTSRGRLERILSHGRTS